ncbi:AIPR family protein [Solibacillus isronensis]|nr:AIPR family protein [Solibacillus isronensis]
MMGFVYSARLYDLFELYNSKGKKLFLKNIRLGIENLMGVDTAIMETLLTNPKEFWYLNNGVTMLVSEDTVTSNYNNYIEIIDPENEKKIGVTVINGAQTINSAAKFFIRRDFNNALKKYVEKNNKEILSEFEKKYKEREDDFERAINEAYVMLKVVEINSESKDVEKKINSITVSLNRQKPVGPVDLAYTLPVISGINMFRNEVYELRGNEKNDSMDLREFVFSIVRKGDASSINNYRYTLDILPRIMLAILDDEPGKAMSSGIKTLLQLNKAGDNFKNENLFPNSKDISLFDNDEEQFSDYNILIDKKIFEQKYKFVNFAMKLYEQIGKQQLRYEFNQKSTGTSKKKFNLYNKYLFIYIIINSLLNSNSLKKDFTNWKYTSSDVEQMLNFSNYIALIDEISGEWQLALENKGVDKIDIWQINSFKKDQYIRDVYKKVENKVRELLLTEIVGSKK